MVGGCIVWVGPLKGLDEEGVRMEPLLGWRVSPRIRSLDECRDEEEDGGLGVSRESHRVW